MSNDGRRRIDDIVPRIEQKLDDHILRFDETKESLLEWQTAHEEWCKIEISRLEREISPLKRTFIQMEKPIRWVGWTVTSIVTGGLLFLGQRIISWAVKHWNW